MPTPGHRFTLGNSYPMHKPQAQPLSARRISAAARSLRTGGWARLTTLAVLATAAALALSLLLRPLVIPNPFLLFLAAVAVSAWAGGIRGGALAAVLSVAVVNRVFFAPSGLSPLAPETLLRSGLFLLVALLVSALSEARLRAEIRAATVGSEMEQSREQLARLQAIAAGLAGALTPADVARVVTCQGIGAVGAQGSVVTLLTADGEALEIIGSAGYPDEVVGRFSRTPLAQHTPLADAVRGRGPIMIRSRAQAAALYPELVPAVEATRLHAWANLPLIVNGAAVGAIEFSFAEPGDLDAAGGLLLTLANQCAQAIDRARLYEAEHTARAGAEEALRQRDAFFAVAAHELRTPLTAILGQAQLLARRLGREEQLDAGLMAKAEIIARQAQRLGNLVTALLDVSRIEQGALRLEREPLDLAALARRVVEEVAPLHPAHRISLTAPAGPLTVLGDGMRLEQVLNNLLSNAVRYSPEGGEVRVELAAEGGEAALRVSDEGIGIPEAALPQLFTRFFRAANTSGQHGAGLGIGLYVVREVTTLHGGSVEVRSAEGAGSSFTVRIPLLHDGGRGG